MWSISTQVSRNICTCVVVFLTFYCCICILHKSGPPWLHCPHGPWAEMVPRICLHSERLQCPSCPPPPVSFLSMTNGPGPKHSPPRPQKPLFFTSPQTLFRSHHRKETRLSICQKCWTLYRCILFTTIMTITL